MPRWAFPVAKNPLNAGDAGDRFDPWVGKISKGGHGNPLVFLPGESRSRGDWWAIDHRIAELDITEMTECVCVHRRAHTHKRKLGDGKVSKRGFLS